MLSKGYISLIERGQRAPSLPFLERTAAHLQVELLDLLNDPTTLRGELVEWSRTATEAELRRVLLAARSGS